MTDRTIDEVLSEHRDEILAAARARVQAIGTDLALGSTVAIEQNLGWLVRLRAGQGLPFADALVSRMFDDIADEIDARLPSATMHEELAEYRQAVHGLIAAAFPGADGGAP